MQCSTDVFVSSSEDCAELRILCQMESENGNLWAIRIVRDGYTREDEVEIRLDGKECCHEIMDRECSDSNAIMLANLLEKAARNVCLADDDRLCEQDRQDCMALVSRMVS